MIHRAALRLAPVLAGFALMACNDETTAPSPVTEDAGAAASLAATAASNQWITRANLPSTERFGPATAVVRTSAQSILYVMGGRDVASGGSLSKVQAYNVATNTWSYKRDMPGPAYETNGTGVINGKIYISGGISRHNGYLSSLNEYDPATNTWTGKRPMPSTSFGGISTVLGTRLYVFTGCDQEHCEDPNRGAFYRYNPATNLWVTLPLPPGSLATAFRGVIGGAIGGKFYVTHGGGQMGIYDPATNSWTAKTPANQPASFQSGATLAGKLYGLTIQQSHSDGTQTTVMKYYDPATNAWTSLAPVRFDVPAGRLTRVQVNGSPRFELVGGPRPGNNMQYIP